MNASEYETGPHDVDPAGEELRALTDVLRPQMGVVSNVAGQWVLLRHADVVAAAEDAQTFSSAVSRHLQVPNGLDGELHREAREVLDRYLTAEALAKFEPIFTQAARDLIASLPSNDVVDAVGEVGAQFAVRGQSAWLGWPAELEPHLLNWMEDNHAATRSGDLARTTKVAADFDAIITGILDARRASADEAAAEESAPADVTAQLMADGWQGRRFTDEELVSILRNWTGGDLGSIALCVGVLYAYLGERPELQEELRNASNADLDAAIDEILRIDDPFPANRRKATCPVNIGGVDIPEGGVVKLHWMSANRDEQVFADPDAFDPQGNAANNLVYGIGPHVCPGRLLATMELRVMVRETLLARTIIAQPGGARREVHPLGGFNRVPVRLAVRI